jgi:hypothetical protein
MGRNPRSPIRARRGAVTLFVARMRSRTIPGLACDPGARGRIATGEPAAERAGDANLTPASSR